MHPFPADAPARCELQHKVFTTMGAVRFRRSSADGVAMMTLQLGEREAMMSLESIQREFCIQPESADGRMLELIGSALDFVSCLEPGDSLPPEICTGEASWQPSPNHVRIASTRVRLDLVTWMSPDSRWSKVAQDELTLLRLADDPALQEAVCAAAEAVAATLNQSAGDAVMRLVEEVARELAYIEALRERLLDRVVSLCRRLARMLAQGGRRTTTFDTLSQIHRLALIAAKQLIGRFEEIDAQTGETGGLLRNIENQRSFIRTNRDWLYRTQRAWEPVLDQWSSSADLPPSELRALLATTYQFLAQRSLPGVAWQRIRIDRHSATKEAPIFW